MTTALGGCRPEPPEGLQQRQKDKDSQTELKYQAKFSFEARVKDELSLTVGDIVTVHPESRRNSTEPGWMYGTCNCQSGYFPASYIVPLDNDSDDDEDIYDDYIEVLPEVDESLPRTGSFAEEGRAPDEGLYINCDCHLPSPQKSMRLKHIYEFLDTEETYITDLETVLFSLINVITTIKSSSSQEEARKVITRWEQLILASRAFFRCLRASETSARGDRDRWMIGQALNQGLPYLTIYQKYCTWVKQAEAVVSKDVSNKLLKDLASAHLGITSYIVKPIQRITKYPLLIEKIVESTPKGHDDYENLQKAFAKATEICHTMNKTTGDIQNSLDLRRIKDIVTFKNSAQKMQFMSGISNRRLIHTEAIMEIKNGREQETVMFLFHDCILLVLPRNPLKLKSSSSIELLNSQQKINLVTSRSAMFLDQLSIPDVEAQERSAFHLLQTVGAEVQSINLKAANGVRRDKWVHLIQEAINGYKLTSAKRRPSPPATPVQKSSPTQGEKQAPRVRKNSQPMTLPTQRAPTDFQPSPSPPASPREEPEYIPHPPVFGTGTLPRKMRTRLPAQTAMFDYVAAYEFRAFKDYHLSLSAGDVVQLDQLQVLGESDWVQVVFQGTSGWVPRNYLQEKSEEPQRRAPNIAPKFTTAAQAAERVVTPKVPLKSPVEKTPAPTMENELERMLRQRKASIQAAEEEQLSKPKRASDPERDPPHRNSQNENTLKTN